MTYVYHYDNFFVIETRVSNGDRQFWAPSLFRIYLNDEPKPKDDSYWRAKEWAEENHPELLL
jgi:hypothetical protein